jgi:DNA-binding GntR family transcriptional regulator
MGQVSDVTGDLETALHLRRESTAEQVAGALRELIISTGLPAGTHLREGPLATQLGVSRNTVREAIQVLVSQGLVTHEIHRGAYVAKLTVDAVRDVFRVRRLVELSAVREVAGKKDLSSLRDAIEALSAVVESGTRNSIAEADLRFHTALVDLMHSERLGELYRSVEAELLRSIALVAPASPEPSRLAKDHRAILSALAKGDAALASERLARHLDRSEQLLISALDTDMSAAEDARSR